MDSKQFTASEQDAATRLCDHAALFVSAYADAGDMAAARVALLRAALELASGKPERLAVLERWHDERRRREALEAL